MYHDIAPYVPFPHFWDWRDTYVFLELQMFGQCRSKQTCDRHMFGMGIEHVA
jgi:hypothetical protein